MILIDCNSWHYRVWRFFYLSDGPNAGPHWRWLNRRLGDRTPIQEISKSLCEYGWCFVLLPFMALMTGLLVLFIGTIYLTVKYPIRLIVKWLIWKPVFHSVKFGVGIARKGKPEREPNLVWQWLVAQHRKVCPLIELKKEE